MTQKELKQILQDRLYRLARILSEYEQFLERRLSTNIFITKRNIGTEDEPVWRLFVVVEFYSFKILDSADKPEFEAYRDSEQREFEFTPEGIDRAIDRWRKKLSREIRKRYGDDDEEDPVVFDEETQKPINKETKEKAA